MRVFDDGHRRLPLVIRRSHRRGQAMVETCLAIVLICLLFFGLFQVIQAYAFREVLHHAAARAARARAVGFNDWMVRKCYRVAAIPNAGRLLNPRIDTVDPELRRALRTLDLDALWELAFASSPVSPLVAVENDLIPDYLGSINAAIGRQILDYEFWGPDDDSWGDGKIGMYYADASEAVIAVRLRQDIPLLVAHADLAAGRLTGAHPGTVRLVGRFDIENHYSLYLEE